MPNLFSSRMALAVGASALLSSAVTLAALTAASPPGASGAAFATAAVHSPDRLAVAPPMFRDPSLPEASSSVLPLPNAEVIDSF